MVRGRRAPRSPRAEIEEAATLLLDEGDGSSSLQQVELVTKLADHARGEEVALAKKARAALAEFVRANLGREDATTAAHVTTALGAIAVGSEPAAGILLRDVLASKASASLRGVALEHLARRGDPKVAGWLADHLDDRALLRSTAKALGERAHGTKDVKLAARLAAAAKRATDAATLGAIADAILSIDADDDATDAALLAMLPELGTLDAVDVSWHLHAITPARAAEVLVEYGVLAAPPERETLEDAERIWRETKAAVAASLRLLSGAGLVAWIDSGAGAPAPRVEDVVRALAAVTASAVMVPEADADDGESARFVARGRTFVRAVDARAVAGVEAIVGWLNASLADVGEPRRFARIAESDGATPLVFADADGLRAAARALYLPIAAI